MSALVTGTTVPRSSPCSDRSRQSGRASASRIPQLVQTMRTRRTAPRRHRVPVELDDRGMVADEAVHRQRADPRARMLPSVITDATSACRPAAVILILVTSIARPPDFARSAVAKAASTSSIINCGGCRASTMDSVRDRGCRRATGTHGSRTLFTAPSNAWDALRITLCGTLSSRSTPCLAFADDRVRRLRGDRPVFERPPGSCRGAT